MRLSELDPHFLARDGQSGWSRHTDLLRGADGIIFLCPKCFAANGGPVGTHSVICWFSGRVPDDVTPGPGRWSPEGTGYDDLTFAGPGAASVRLNSGCRWHGFVRDGEVTEA